ncbi:integrase [Aquimarina agarivorans]|uniref:integrase n=1 Tax=Aquimarina agarivorans TaxID=980584 RepID=UPI000248F911|nr:integrase [Aquimarina agarivorans]
MRTPFVSEKRYWIYKTNKKGKPVKSHKKIEMLSGDANLKAHKTKLLEFKERLILLFEKDSANGTVISKDWLKQAINDSHSVIEGVKNTNTEYQKILKQQELLELNLKRNLLKEAITTIYSKYASNEGELKKFKTTFCWIEKFEKYNSKIYNISDFNQQFIDSFKSWATIDEGYRLSTAINHLKRTKRAIEYVYFNDTEDIIKVHKQLSNLKFTSSNELEKDLEKIVVTLNFNELDKIEQFDFSYNNSLQEAQKCILIGCETGLRFSDFNKLNESNYKRSIDGIEYWEFKTSKTKKWVQITNSDRLKYLTNKYGLPNTSYSENDDISLNRQIKRVCLKVGLKGLVKGDLTISEKLEDGNYKKRLVRGLYPKYKLMTTRTFRRSFATNYYGKIPISDIMRVTGHATERMLRNYINATDDKNISIAYKNINEFHKKRQEEIKLKKVD